MIFFHCKYFNKNYYIYKENENVYVENNKICSYVCNTYIKKENNTSVFKIYCVPFPLGGDHYSEFV